MGSLYTHESTQNTLRLFSNTHPHKHGSVDVLCPRCVIMYICLIKKKHRSDSSSSSSWALTINITHPPCVWLQLRERGAPSALQLLVSLW